MSTLRFWRKHAGGSTFPKPEPDLKRTQRLWKPEFNLKTRRMWSTLWLHLFPKVLWHQLAQWIWKRLWPSQLQVFFFQNMFKRKLQHIIFEWYFSRWQQCGLWTRTKSIWQKNFKGKRQGEGQSKRGAAFGVEDSRGYCLWCLCLGPFGNFYLDFEKTLWLSYRIFSKKHRCGSEERVQQLQLMCNGLAEGCLQFKS